MSNRVEHHAESLRLQAQAELPVSTGVAQDRHPHRGSHCWEVICGARYRPLHRSDVDVAEVDLPELNAEPERVVARNDTQEVVADCVSRLHGRQLRTTPMHARPRLHATMLGAYARCVAASATGRPTDAENMPLFETGRVLPVTILFAFYPGVLGLRLATP